jgi:hypothetical protein
VLVVVGGFGREVAITPADDVIYFLSGIGANLSVVESTEAARAFSNAFVSWIPPSWKLTGSKIIESPLGLLIDTCSSGSMGGASLSERLVDSFAGSCTAGRSSSPVKLKNSNENARSRWNMAISDVCGALLESFSIVSPFSFSEWSVTRSEKSKVEAKRGKKV